MSSVLSLKAAEDFAIIPRQIGSLFIGIGADAYPIYTEPNTNERVVTK